MYGINCILKFSSKQSFIISITTGVPLFAYIVDCVHICILQVSLVMLYLVVFDSEKIAGPLEIALLWHFDSSPIDRLATIFWSTYSICFSQQVRFLHIGSELFCVTGHIHTLRYWICIAIRIEWYYYETWTRY